MFGNRGPEIRVQLRAQAGEDVVGSGAGVVEAHRQVCAPLESLVVSEINRAGILYQQRHREGTTCLLTEVVFLKRAGENRIEAANRRPEAKCRTDQSIGAGAKTSRSQAGAACGRARLRSDAPHATARCVEHQTHGRAEDSGSRPGAQDVGVGNIHRVAGNGNVEVVLERQSDGVVERKIELAIVQKLFDSSGIAQIRRWQTPGPVGTNRIRKV